MGTVHCEFIVHEGFIFFTVTLLPAGSRSSLVSSALISLMISVSLLSDIKSNNR